MGWRPFFRGLRFKVSFKVFVDVKAGAKCIGGVVIPARRRDYDLVGGITVLMAHFSWVPCFML